MKKILFWAAFALFFQSHAVAQGVSGDDADSPGSVTVLSPWYLGMGLGVAAPAQDFNPDFTLGAGGVLFGGYRLSPLLALQLDLNPWFYSGAGSTLYDYRAFCDFRFIFPSPALSTYLFLGPGYDVQVNNPGGYSTSSLAGVAGLGFQFDIRPGEHVFVEARYNILFYRNFTQQDVPVLFGISEDL